jgi:hypothetical protein
MGNEHLALATNMLVSDTTRTSEKLYLIPNRLQKSLELTTRNPIQGANNGSCASQKDPGSVNV